MCRPDEIRRIHQSTNDEIRCILAEMSGHAEAVADQELSALIVRLREVMAKRFLINSLADWQRDGQE